MLEIWNFLKGKKTYIIAVSGVILAILEMRNIFTVPKELWIVLAAAGATTLRSGIQSAIQSAKDELNK